MINYAVVVEEICTHKYKNITSADWLITAITHLHCVVIRTSSATNERTDTTIICKSMSFQSYLWSKDTHTN